MKFLTIYENKVGVDSIRHTLDECVGFLVWDLQRFIASFLVLCNLQLSNHTLCIKYAFVHVVAF